MPDVLTLAAFYPALPELLLAAGAMALLMLGAYRGDRITPVAVELAAAFLVLAGIVIATMPSDGVTAFGGSFVVDGFARFLKLLAVASSIGTLVISRDFLS